MFFEDLPHDLRQSAYPLIEELGTNEFAWTYEEAKRVLIYLAEHHYAILGGDVLEKRQGRFAYTYDNWSHERGEQVEWNDYVVQSQEKALTYVDFYYEKNGYAYYYVPVAINETRWKWIQAMKEERERQRKH